MYPDVVGERKRNQRDSQIDKSLYNNVVKVKTLTFLNKKKT